MISLKDDIKGRDYLNPALSEMVQWSGALDVL